MVFNLWSIILIASLTQCLFLFVIFLVKDAPNKKARNLFLILLFVIFAINFSNFFYASYLYKEYPWFAGSTRGMILLIGPAIYFYVKSILQPDFRLKALHSLHIIPYLIVLGLLLSMDLDTSKAGSAEQAIEAFMHGKLPITIGSILRFVVYISHLVIYTMAARMLMTRSLGKDDSDYLISLQIRVKWLKRITAFSITILILLIGLTLYMVFTGYYTYFGNFILTVTLSGLVYLLAYQSLLDSRLLSPDFKKKYGQRTNASFDRQTLVNKISQLFEEEQIYTDPDLKLNDLAKLLDTKAHILSEVINSAFGKNFNEFVNQYRLDAFKKLSKDKAYKNYSILGLAYEVGFNSKSSFYNSFKKHVGMTPSKYLSQPQ